MEEIKKLPKRSEVPKELTWDIDKIFKNEFEFNKQLKETKLKAEQFELRKNTLSRSGNELLKALEEMLSIENQIDILYVYASMKNDQDTSNEKNQGLKSIVQKIVSDVLAKLSWFEPELLKLDYETLQSFYKEVPQLTEYRHFLDKIFLKKKHILSEKEESLLARASDILNSSEDIFSVLDNTDLDFGSVKDDFGNKVQLSDGIYGKLLESLDQNVRKEAYERLYKVYTQFKNTFAKTLATTVREHNFQAKIRHFKNAEESSLLRNNIPDSVYSGLIETVEKNLPLLHRYVELRKKVLKLDKVHMYDMYTPLLKSPDTIYDYKKAKQVSIKALSILGDDYIEHVKEAYENRWIDVVENEGKMSGAYSSGTYGTAPYILLNWQDNLNNLYTLVHEMGHSMHSFYTTHNQPYQYGSYPIFLAEIASTTNENLLTHYLLKTQTDEKIRAYILNHYLDGFKGTVFRQTQFAQFERWIHRQDEKGIALTAETMAKYYGNLNQKYYGSEIVNDEQIKYEWARIPHFYFDFYVYQYATGFSAATTLSQNIINNQNYKEKYLKYLKSGSSDYPLNIMKDVGVDMTNTVYLDKAFAIFEERLNELESLI